MTVEVNIKVNLKFVVEHMDIDSFCEVMCLEKEDLLLLPWDTEFTLSRELAIKLDLIDDRECCLYCGRPNLTLDSTGICEDCVKTFVPIKEEE